jgi:hypothetical protein
VHGGRAEFFARGGGFGDAFFGGGDEREGRALFGEVLGDCAPDAARCAGDKGFAVRECTAPL